MKQFAFTMLVEFTGDKSLEEATQYVRCFLSNARSEIIKVTMLAATAPYDQNYHQTLPDGPIKTREGT